MFTGSRVSNNSVSQYMWFWLASNWCLISAFHVPLLGLQGHLAVQDICIGTCFKLSGRSTFINLRRPYGTGKNRLLMKLMSIHLWSSWSFRPNVDGVEWSVSGSATQALRMPPRGCTCAESAPEWTWRTRGTWWGKLPFSSSGSSSLQLLELIKYTL